MKKFLIYLGLFACIPSFAFKMDIYEEEFEKSFWNGKAQIEKTKLYQEAIETLENRKYDQEQTLKSRQYGDKNFRLPNFKRAYDLFLESAKKEKNLASMFMALKIRNKVEFNLNLNKKERRKWKEKQKEIALVLSERLMINKNCYGGIIYYSLSKKKIPTNKFNTMFEKCDSDYAQGLFYIRKMEKKKK